MNERNKKKNCQIENRSDVFVIDLRKKKIKKKSACTGCARLQLQIESAKSNGRKLLPAEYNRQSMDASSFQNAKIKNQTNKYKKRKKENKKIGQGIQEPWKDLPHVAATQPPKRLPEPE